MRKESILFIEFLLVSALFLVLPGLTSAQTKTVPSRITQAVDEANLTLLKGNTHPLARLEFDRGPAPASLPMERMLLVLKRSPDQEAALKTLLDEQQDSSSPNYHQWLTPEQFGQQFGPSDQDIQAVTSWLGSHGFQVAHVSKGRTVIEFSGDAAQVQEAFRTSIHKYAVNGEDHWANSSDPQIPTALTPVVAGVDTLHNFLKKPQLIIADEEIRARYEPGLPPQFSTSSGLHALTPTDYAVIYNINPLYNAATKINGSGTTIAVVGRTDIFIQDVRDFRSVFGLAPNDPQIVINGPDPGVVSLGEQGEATLDTSWSGAVAPGATVKLVVSASTNTADGVDLSEVYIIENNLGNVMTESFSGCENQAGITSADASAVSALAEQAAAQGITYMVSTGDSGAEGCDNPNTETAATGPLSVNILASTPYTVAVGGTLFTEGANSAKYWSPTNNPTTLASALSYIPEDVWNESCASGQPGCSNPNIWAGGGGASVFYKKPVWQSGVQGIPAGDPMRDLPDVSLSAAGHDPYLLCMQYSCENNGSGYISFYGVSGTSASAPSFAGVMALVNQKMSTPGSNPTGRQGQANYVLYRLAAQETLSGCNASIQSPLPATTCIFNDVTVGNNAVPGETGYGTSSAKYQSGIGYDLATGLGSVNVANLVNSWGNARSILSATAITLPTGTLVHGAPISIGVNVAPKTGSGTPTGDVSLVTSNNLILPFATLDNTGLASATTNQLPGGTYNLTAHYEGDGTFLPSDSAPTAVTISPEPSTTVLVVQSQTIGPCTPFITIPYTMTICLGANVTGSSSVGIPTGNVTFKDSNSGLNFSMPLDYTGSVLTYIGGNGSPSLDLAVGPHSIVASYSGDSNFQSGNSPAFNFNVTKDPTTTTVDLPTYPQLVEGQASNIQITVSGSTFGDFPTGTVTLYDGATQIGTAATYFAYGQSGAASIPFTPDVHGHHTLTASYSGDTNYLASTSTATAAIVYYGTTTTITSSASTTQAGQSVTLSAQVVSSQIGGPPITGSVQFTVNGIGLPVVAVTNGLAQLTTSSLPGGTDQIWAYYSGDSNYAASNSSLVETVNFLGTTTTLTSSAPTIQQGQNVTFTAQVAPTQSGGPALTGGVMFTANGAYIGGATLTNNQAQVTTNSLPIGSVQIQANYGGDTDYATSSATLAETVNGPPTFTASANPATITIASPGGSGSTVLTFTGTNGFAGTINLSPPMCSGLPSESACSFGASSVILSATTTTATSTFTITTTAPSSAFPRTIKSPKGIGWQMLGTGIAIAFLCLMSLRARRWRWSAVFAALLFATVLTGNGCGGGGGSGGGGGGGGNLGTPIGSYTVTISISSGGEQVIAPVSVVVN